MIDAVWDTGSQRTAISEEAFNAIGLKRGATAHVQGSAGITEGWETECKLSLTEYDQWEVEVDVLPELIVSDGVIILSKRLLTKLAVFVNSCF